MNSNLTRLVLDRVGLKSIRFKDGGVSQSASYTWYRGSDCNFGPMSDHLGHWTGYRDYFLDNLVPPSPIIDHTTHITAFGSCFAENISHWLASRNYKVLSKDEKSKAYVVRAGEGFVNTYSILQQFEWAFEGKSPSVELWHGYDASEYGYNEEARLETLDLFQRTDVFILTFGLSEVWYDKPTGEVFWRAIPQRKYDDRRHGFRTVSPDENYQNISAILKLIQKHRPGATIITTLSPIPLVATFRPLPCPVSNSFSKASLRCALDRVFSERDGHDGVYYWPSYEIVLDGFRDTWQEDLRHVRKPILTFVMKMFERYWCRESDTDLQISRALYNAKAVDGSINRGLHRKLKNADPSQVVEILSTVEESGKMNQRLLRTVKETYLDQAIL